MKTVVDISQVPDEGSSVILYAQNGDSLITFCFSREQLYEKPFGEHNPCVGWLEAKRKEGSLTPSFF